MIRQQSTGFTIIELMLFLGLTGLILIGILVSSGTAVTRQRYIDAVYSLQSTLQDQYTEVVNTRNTGLTNSECSSSRGQSNCVILGKFIEPTDDRKSLKVETVYGVTPSSDISTSSDTEIFRAYLKNSSGNYRNAIAEGNQQTIGWGFVMQKPSPKEPIEFNMAILRSPVSGSIRTYISTVTNAGWGNILVDQTENLIICLDDSGTAGLAGRMGVRIVAGASSTTGVQYVGDGTKIDPNKPNEGGCA